jgi:phage-related holin
MEIGSRTANGAGALVSATVFPLIDQTLKLMIPWLIAMFLVITVDLIAGIRKSLKLGIHISVSNALRNTMGKMVTYFSFVIMVCVIDVAAGTNSYVAKWSCLFICAIEGLSIVGNILKPYGIDLSLKGIIKIFARHAIGMADEEINDVVRDEKIDVIRRQEKEKWDKKK